VGEVPSLPRQRARLMKFMDKVQEQAPVLPVEILDAEAALLFRQQNLIPSN
jgi:hypothetical protein